jgi:ergothioneine biosynthesis protein EgtB
MASHRAEVAPPRARGLRERFPAVRTATVRLAAPLSPEDQLVQSMPDASPTKWHLAHTTWFFETFVLSRFVPRYRAVDERYAYLFNSYYEAVGPRQPRPLRGAMTRPSLDEVRAYRDAIDERMESFLDGSPEGGDVLDRIELGLQHEQQHQELILTDIQHALWSNPVRPAYVPDAAGSADNSFRSELSAPPSIRSRTGERKGTQAATWAVHHGGLVEIGFAGDGFSFDNERPRHRTFLEPFRLARRAVTAGEYLQFVEDGAYRRPELWLSDGWAAVQAHGWTAPLYWEERGGAWAEFTLRGTRRLDLDAPVGHVSYYEAEAFARWAGARLPTEAEWETLAATGPVDGHFVESGTLAPRPAHEPDDVRPAQMFGDVWEWTASAYLPYPRYRPLEGELGEYNGKFMSGQMVLRGGSCFTPRSHVRATYRNFFPPAARWQMSGIRLARWD